MKKAAVWASLAAVAVCFAIIAINLATGGGAMRRSVREGATDARASAIADATEEQATSAAEDADGQETDNEGESAGEDESEDESEEPQTEEEKREAEEEKKVDLFDDLTDKWMEPAADKVTMAEVDNFAKVFRQVPKNRQDECVHRALNLIPDENVMLLVGILMDKTMDSDIVETVFNDILNRDEEVKKPILQQIFKDKSHPCWTDVAWILDVTGEIPKK